MIRLRFVIAIFCLLLPLIAHADVTSGPTVGEKVPALKVFAVTGDPENKELDYTAQRKDKPTVYVFVLSQGGSIPVGGRPTGRFMKELDKSVKKDFEGAYIVAVWLTEDQEKTKEFLPKIQQSLQFEVTGLTYFQGEKIGPKEWTINSDAHVTVVVANKQKVKATFGYMSINETDVPAVTKALKEALQDK